MVALAYARGVRTSRLIRSDHAEFWAVLEGRAAALDISLAALLKQIDAARGRRPLASACRVSALEWAAAAAAQTRPE